MCEVAKRDRRRFRKDFETHSMRVKLEGMLGLRGLAPVIEGTFRLRQDELRNEVGKIVCRLEWSFVSAGKRGGEEVLRSCRVLVLPLLVYESEAVRVVEYLTQRGARTSGVGPLEVLLRHANREPQQYTLRPAFGLQRETPAREAVRRIALSILEIATRLKELAELKSGYDVILMNCPPNITLLSENVFRASDAILVPVIPTVLSRRTFGILSGRGPAL